MMAIITTPTEALKQVLMPIYEDIEDGLAGRVERAVTFDIGLSSMWRVLDIATYPRHQCVHIQLYRTSTHTHAHTHFHKRHHCSFKLEVWLTG